MSMTTTVIDVINDDVVAGLLEGGWPALQPLLIEDPPGTRVEGRILVGNRHMFAQYMPPRIIFTPIASSFGPRETTRGAVTVAGDKAKLSTESRAAVANPAFLSEMATFEVACWGAADTVDPTNPSEEWTAHLRDWEYTRALYLQVLASMQKTMPNCFEVGSGTWRDVQHSRRVGREFVFQLRIGLPILYVPPPVIGEPGLPFASGSVQVEIHDYLVGPDGITGPGCEP